MATKGQYKDYTGQRFGKLVALKRIGLHHNGRSLWKWQCDCGKIIERTTPHIVRGDTKSCGCHRSDVSKKLLVKVTANMTGKARIDITGQKFNMLTAINFIGRKGNRNSYWLWQCECGNQVELQSDVVQSGHTKSCGCKSPAYDEKIYKQQVQHNRENAAKLTVFNSYRQAAKRRGIVFNLSLDDFLILTQQDCFYCKAPPSNKSKGNKTNNKEFIYSGIDRLNNDKNIGYVLSNLVPCCVTCNRAKNKLNFNEWKELVYTITDNLREKKI